MIDTMKISTKVKGSFFLLVLIAAALSAVGIFNTYRIDKKYSTAIESTNAKIKHTVDAMVEFGAMRTITRDLILNANDPGKYLPVLNEMRATQERIGGIAGNYGATLSQEKEVADFDANG